MVNKNSTSKKDKTPSLRFAGFCGEPSSAKATKGNWEEKRLGEVAEINPSQENLPNEFIYIDLESVEKGNLKQKNKIKKDCAPSRAQRVLQKHDILFQMVRPYQQNNFYFNFNGDYVASTGYAQIRTEQVPMFIYQYLHISRFLNDVLVRCTGSNYPAINSSDFKKIRINLPSLPEQQKIAEFLGAVDEWIENLRAQKENLKFYKKGMMQKIFSQKIRFKNDEGKNFPKWEEKRLGEVCITAKSGGTPTSTKKEYYNGNIPFLSIADMTKNGKYILKTEKSITQEGLENSSAWIVPENSLVYSMYASVGFVAINKIPLTTSQAMINLIVNKNISSIDYIYYYLLFFKKFIHRFIETGTQGNLNAQIVKKIPVPIPSLPEQQKIADFLTSIDNLINSKQQQITQAEEWKKGLMQGLFV